MNSNVQEERIVERHYALHLHARHRQSAGAQPNLSFSFTSGFTASRERGSPPILRCEELPPVSPARRSRSRALDGLEVHPRPCEQR